MEDETMGKRKQAKIKTRRNSKVRLPRSIRKLFPNVTNAVDASQPIEVFVEEADCKTAEPLNPAECALARAAKREFKADGVIIGMSVSYIIKNNKAVRFQTPAHVQRELVSFDRHSDFSPGEYKLSPKSPTARLGQHEKYHTNPDKKMRRKVHLSARVRVLPTGTSNS